MFNNYLVFSDAAKFADIARNVISGSGYVSNFNFWNSLNHQWIQPLTPYSIALFFKLFGVNDMAVIGTSVFYYLLTLVFVFLLSTRLYKNNLISILSTIAVGFNYNIINYAVTGASESPFMFELLAGMYFQSYKKWQTNILGLIFIILMYFTRPQAIIYIFGFILYYFFANYSLKRAIIYSVTTFVVGTVLYLIFSRQGLIAITQNIPGVAVSDSLRGSEVNFNLLVLIKKVAYNLYNFYKALPEIMNPYIFVLFVIGIFRKQSLFNIFVLFVSSLTFMVTALTIPFYRYIHPVVPFIYIIGVATLIQIISDFEKPPLGIKKDLFIKLVSIFLVLIFSVGQTLGILLLDSRFERKMHNIDKAPIYALMSYKLKEIIGKDDLVVTNLDTWGSWYGERKTMWFPLEPKMILPLSNDIDAIYLTSYKIDDENYYMGSEWRMMFDNPKEQKILPEYKFVGEYNFKAEDNYEKENGKSILFVKR